MAGFEPFRAIFKRARRAGFTPRARLAAVGGILAVLALPGHASAQELLLGADLGAHVACHATQQSHPCIFMRVGAHAGLDLGGVGLSAGFIHVPAKNYSLTYDLYNFWGALDVRVAPSLWAVLGVGSRNVRLWRGDATEWRGGLLGLLGASFREPLARGGPIRFRSDLLLEISHFEDGVNVAPANTLRIEPAITLGLEYLVPLR